MIACEDATAIRVENDNRLVERIGQYAEGVTKGVRLKKPCDQVVARSVAGQYSNLDLGIGLYLVTQAGRQDALHGPVLGNCTPRHLDPVLA